MTTERRDAPDLRAAWEAGIALARRYGDNFHHLEGEQKERQWERFVAALAAQHDNSAQLDTRFPKPVPIWSCVSCGAASALGDRNIQHYANCNRPSLTGRPEAFCNAQHAETGAVCELQPGHAQNHRGQFDNGIAQWPRAEAGRPDAEAQQCPGPTVSAFDCPVHDPRKVQPPASGPGAWQPIETAPKDGTAILAYFPDADEVHQVMKVDWREFQGNEDEAWWCLTDEDPGDYLGVEPTHWQPLPSPPIAPSSQEPR